MNTQALLDNVATVNVNEAIIVSAKEFLKALKFVVTATSKKQSRPILRYIHAKIGENELTLGATDSHQLTQLKMAAEVDQRLAGKEFLINSKFARNLSKTPTKHGKNMVITPEYDEDGLRTGLVKYADGNHELFIDDHDGFEGHYPDLDICIPYRSDYSFDVQTKELLPVLKELKKFTNVKDGNVVHLEIQDNSGVVIGVDGDDSSIQEIKQKNLFIEEKHIVENDKGLNFEINFNLKYLIGLVQKCDSTEFLKFSFSGTLRPFTFIRENGGIGEICPIRTY